METDLIVRMSYSMRYTLGYSSALGGLRMRNCQAYKAAQMGFIISVGGVYITQKHLMNAHHQPQSELQKMITS